MYLLQMTLLLHFIGWLGKYGLGQISRATQNSEGCFLLPGIGLTHLFGLGHDLGYSHVPIRSWLAWLSALQVGMYLRRPVGPTSCSMTPSCSLRSR